MQGDIVYLTNKQRALHGCKALHLDARLTAASVGHSAYMAASGAFSHTGRGGSNFAYRVRVAHYPRPLAENIAYGYRTGLDVVKAWMASPDTAPTSSTARPPRWASARCTRPAAPRTSRRTSATDHHGTGRRLTEMMLVSTSRRGLTQLLTDFGSSARFVGPGREVLVHSLDVAL